MDLETKKTGFFQLRFKRIQSPSSINTYKQCPRKYYYQYIKKLPTKPNIHLVRGNIAHSVLENFFKINISNISDKNFEFELKIILHELLSRHWKSSSEKLNMLKISEDQFKFFFDDTKEMLQLWLLKFLDKLKLEMNSLDFYKAFQKLTPITEQHFVSKKYGVQGFIDAIHNNNGEITLIDYKTSKKDTITDDYKLQLAIYSMLFYEKHGKKPSYLGIDFLKYGEKIISFDDSFIDLAENEIKDIHKNTMSDNIDDYPKKPSRLCKWSTGQCDFYDICHPFG